MCATSQSSLGALAPQSGAITPQAGALPTPHALAPQPAISAASGLGTYVPHYQDQVNIDVDIAYLYSRAYRSFPNCKLNPPERCVLGFESPRGCVVVRGRTVGMNKAAGYIIILYYITFYFILFLTFARAP